MLVKAPAAAPFIAALQPRLLTFRLNQLVEPRPPELDSWDHSAFLDFIGQEACRACGAQRGCVKLLFPYMVNCAQARRLENLCLEHEVGWNVDDIVCGVVKIAFIFHRHPPLGGRAPRHRLEQHIRELHSRALQQVALLHHLQHNILCRTSQRVHAALWLQLTPCLAGHLVAKAFGRQKRLQVLLGAVCKLERAVISLHCLDSHTYN